MTSGGESTLPSSSPSATSSTDRARTPARAPRKRRPPYGVDPPDASAIPTPASVANSAAERPAAMT